MPKHKRFMAGTTYRWISPPTPPEEFSKLRVLEMDVWERRGESRYQTSKEKDNITSILMNQTVLKSEVVVNEFIHSYSRTSRRWDNRFITFRHPAMRSIILVISLGLRKVSWEFQVNLSIIKHEFPRYPRIEGLIFAEQAVSWNDY